MQLHSIAYNCRYIQSPTQATILSIPKSLEDVDAFHTAEEIKLNSNTLIKDKDVETFHTEETKPNNNTVIQHKVIETSSRKNVPITRCSFEQRGAYLKSQCPNSGGPSLLERLEQKEWNDTTKHLPEGIWMPRTMFIDTKHKMFICLVLKAGSTTYNSLMVQYSDNFIAMNLSESAHDRFGSNVRRPDRFGVRKANGVSPKQLKEALQHYTKVIAVPHPFTRLHSFYKSKVLGGICKTAPSFYQHLIIKEARNITVHPPKDACKMNITFSEFFHWFRPRAGRFGNLHVKRMMHSCRPCDIDYDTFLRVETSDEDQVDLIDTVFAPKAEHELKAKAIKLNIKKAGESEADSRFSKRLVEYEGFDKSDIDWMRQYYKDDMRMFGYNVEYKGNELKGNCELDGKKCC